MTLKRCGTGACKGEHCSRWEGKQSNLLSSALRQLGCHLTCALCHLLLSFERPSTFKDNLTKAAARGQQASQTGLHFHTQHSIDKDSRVTSRSLRLSLVRGIWSVSLCAASSHGNLKGTKRTPRKQKEDTLSCSAVSCISPTTSMAASRRSRSSSSSSSVSASPPSRLFASVQITCISSLSCQISQHVTAQNLKASPGQGRVRTQYLRCMGRLAVAMS